MQQPPHLIRTLEDAEAVVASFLSARRAQHGDLQMRTDDPGKDDPAGGKDDPPKDGDLGKDDPSSGDDPDDDKGTDQLGDPGKQALDRMKTQRNEAREQLRAFQTLGLSPEQIKALQKPAPTGDGKGDPPVDVEAIRKEARDEATRAALHDRVLDKIEARARGFADPEDAVAILLRSHKPDDFLDGDKIDIQEIEDALKELLEKKPHLAATAQGGQQRRFGGGADGGARNESRPEQLTRAQLAGMSPQDIEKARLAGRLNDVLGIKS